VTVVEDGRIDRKAGYELADIMASRFINAAAVSDDGAWFGYHLGPTGGDGEFIFRETRSDRALRFPAGEVGLGRPAAPVFFPDAKFGAFTVYPTRADAAQLRRQRRPLLNAAGRRTHRDSRLTCARE